MAIHADHLGLTVEIFVDGKPLEEYEEEEEEEDASKTTTRYVECRSGAEFAIHTNFKAPFAPMDMDVRVYLDGTSMNRRMVHRHEMLAEPYIQFRTKWRNGEKWHASKFLFSDLDVGMKDSVEHNSEQTYQEDLKTLNAVGTISVVLTPILRYRKSSRPQLGRMRFREIGPVSEEAIKGDVRSHVIRLAPSTVANAPGHFKCKYAAEPLVTFKFKYRSNAALKSLGMITRSPSPSPIPEPELIKKRTPEPTANVPTKTVSSSATPQPKAASPTPAPPQPVSPTPNEHDGLTDEDVIALIKYYRGNDKGLAGQNRKRLLVLLKHYEDKDNESVPVKQDAVSSESLVRIKRNHTDHGAARGEGKKRKSEVIVLDE